MSEKEEVNENIASYTSNNSKIVRKIIELGELGDTDKISEYLRSDIGFVSDAAKRELRSCVARYRFELNHRQAVILLGALEAYWRIGLMQFRAAVFDSLSTMYDYKLDTYYIEDALWLLGEVYRNNARKVTGKDYFDEPDVGRAAYDLHCVLRNKVAVTVRTDKTCVWRDTPSHKNRKIPLASVTLEPKDLEDEEWIPVT